jgi:hypothetical protein
MFNIYYSPIVKAPNLQVPKSDYIGMSTFLHYRNESVFALEYAPNSYRFFDAIYGHFAKRTNIFFENSKVMPPDHFGYQNETFSYYFYNNSKYLLVNELGRGFYKNIYPEFEYKWRFIPKDFERLNFDDKLQKIYSNRYLEIFKISDNG